MHRKVHYVGSSPTQKSARGPVGADGSRAVAFGDAAVNGQQWVGVQVEFARRAERDADRAHTRAVRCSSVCSPPPP